jgi:hypothetical protein
MGKGIRDFKRAINEPDSIPVPLIEAAAAATSGTISDKTS